MLIAAYRVVDLYRLREKAMPVPSPFTKSPPWIMKSCHMLPKKSIKATLMMRW